MNDSNKQLSDFINGIGAVAEMVGIIRDNLIQNGFTRNESCHIVGMILTGMLTGTGEKKTD